MSNVESSTSPHAESVSTAAPKTATTSGLAEWLDVAASPAETSRANRLEQFLQATTVADALDVWFDSAVPQEACTISRRLSVGIAKIDELLNDQVNAILHHERFQELESAWRGVEYLVDQADELGDATLQVRCFSASWKEIETDFAAAMYFDQTVLFKHVYEQEFGIAGGQPLGMIVADYDVHPKITRDHPHDDVEIMQSLSQVGAAAFCPILLNASPAMFGLDDFTDLERDLQLEPIFQRLDYQKFRKLRESEDSRFLGLAMPRILMREPYGDQGIRCREFPFVEDVSAAQGAGYLWGGASFALAAVTMRAYAEAGWFADIRGVHRGERSGGMVTGLPSLDFLTDAHQVAPKSVTDVSVPDQLEKTLSELGFIPLCACQDSSLAAFYSIPSLQRPKTYRPQEKEASLNAQISSMLHYILCVSRFAHILKVYGRDLVGSLRTPEDMQRELRSWLSHYTTPDDEASADVKARYPLRAADVRVMPKPGDAGVYDAIFQLMPHYQFDDAKASITLKTELFSRPT